MPKKQKAAPAAPTSKTRTVSPLSNEPAVGLVHGLIDFLAVNEAAFTRTSGRPYRPSEVFTALFNVAVQKLILDTAIDHIVSPTDEAYDTILAARSETVGRMLTEISTAAITNECDDKSVLNQVRLRVSPVGGRA